MPAPETPDPIPNPYAERPLDDDSADALAALLFDRPSPEATASTEAGPAASSPSARTGHHTGNGARGDHSGDAVATTALSHEVTSTPVEGAPPSIDRSIVEATGTLFAPIDGQDALGPPLTAGRPLFDGEPPVDPDEPGSLRWSKVVHEPTVAEMGGPTAGGSSDGSVNGGRRLFLEDEPSISVPPRLIVAPPDRYGAGSSAFAELLERRWHWFAVAGVTGLLIGFVAFTLGRGGDGQDRFPSVSAQSGEDGADSVADTVPAGPALAANDDGNTGSFKGAPSSSSTPPATAPRRTGGVTTTQPSTSGSTTTGSSTSSPTTDPSSTTSTSRSTTTVVSSTTSTSRPTTTTSGSTTTTTQATTTTTAASTTTADPSTTTDPSTTSSSSTSSTTVNSTTTATTADTTPIPGEDTAAP